MLCDGVFCTPVEMASHFPRFPRRGVFAGTPVQVQAVFKSGARRLPLPTLPHPPSTLHSLQQRSNMCLAETDNRQRTAGREKKESETRFDTITVAGGWGATSSCGGEGQVCIFVAVPAWVAGHIFCARNLFPSNKNVNGLCVSGQKRLQRRSDRS